MYYLMVSYDAGMTYGLCGYSKDKELLVKRGAKFDARMLRWFIEDGDGEIDYDTPCKIHEGIIDTVTAFRGGK